MDSLLTKLFDQERARVFEPAPDFCRQVMSRLVQEPERQTLWDTVLATTKPILALAFILVMVVVCLEIEMPVEPSRGLTQIYLESEISGPDELLYLDSPNPPTTLVLQQLISADPE